MMCCYNFCEGVTLMTNMGNVVEQLKKARTVAVREVERLDVAIAALDGGQGRRTLSAAGRARIVAAQKARWASTRAKDGNLVTMPRKRTMSAAARKKIASAQRARWAKVRAAKKSA